MKSSDAVSLEQSYLEWKALLESLPFTIEVLIDSNAFDQNLLLRTARRSASRAELGFYMPSTQMEQWWDRVLRAQRASSSELLPSQVFVRDLPTANQALCLGVPAVIIQDPLLTLECWNQAQSLLHQFPGRVAFHLESMGQILRIQSLAKQAGTTSALPVSLRMDCEERGWLSWWGESREVRRGSEFWSWLDQVRSESFLQLDRIELLHACNHAAFWSEIGVELDRRSLKFDCVVWNEEDPLGVGHGMDGLEWGSDQRVRPAVYVIRRVIREPIHGDELICQGMGLGLLPWSPWGLARTESEKDAVDCITRLLLKRSNRGGEMDSEDLKVGDAIILRPNHAARFLEHVEADRVTYFRP